MCTNFWTARRLSLPARPVIPKIALDVDPYRPFPWCGADLHGIVPMSKKIDNRKNIGVAAMSRWLGEGATTVR